MGMMGTGLPISTAFRLGLALALALASGACGDPEAPVIGPLYVISCYEEDPPEPQGEIVGGEEVLDGGIAACSPITVVGRIMDNVAVVEPKLTLVGKRRDVHDTEKLVLRQGDHFSVGFPGLRLADGDALLLTATGLAGERTEIVFAFSEIGNDLFRVDVIEASGEGPDIRHTCPEDQDVVWAYDLEITGTVSAGRIVPSIEALLYRESIARRDLEEELEVHPTRGKFAFTMSLIDPRSSWEIASDPLARLFPPSYSLEISAIDPADQGDKEGRMTVRSMEFIFSPPRDAGLRYDLEAPELSFISPTEDEIGEGTLVWEESEFEVTAVTLDNAGEPKEIGIYLNDKPVFFVDKSYLSLEGAFTQIFQLERSILGDMTNRIRFRVEDINGRIRQRLVNVLFDIPDTDSEPPAIFIAPSRPAPDEDGEVIVPVGGAMNLTGVILDDGGEPSVFMAVMGGTIENHGLGPLCPERVVTDLPLNLQGGFPQIQAEHVRISDLWPWSVIGLWALDAAGNSSFLLITFEGGDILDGEMKAVFTYL